MNKLNRDKQNRGRLIESRQAARGGGEGIQQQRKKKERENLWTWATVW